MPRDESGVRGAETPALVLVVDDEESMRKVLVRELEGLGHACATAASAEAALRSFDELHPIALLITDLHLPAMSGVELVEQLRQRSQLLPAILMSGDLTEEARARASVLERVELLEKPFAMAELRHLVARIGYDHDPQKVG